MNGDVAHAVCSVRQIIRIAIVAGVDASVKTLYYPPRRSKEPQNFHSPIQGRIVNSRHTSLRIRPITGQHAFVRGVAMSLAGVVGGCSYPSTRAMHLAAALKRPQWNFENDDQMHPGEGSA